MNNEEKTVLTDSQKTLLVALHESACNIALACSKSNISRSTYYYWLKTSPAFKSRVEEEREALIDLAESKLLMNINEGKEASIFFFLKTQGKKRGYIETVEQDLKVNPFEQLMKDLPDDE